MQKVILITGASSGIGYAAAERLAKAGHIVYGAARRVERMDPLREAGVIPVRLDVTDPEACKTLVQDILSREGRIDALVNNAGYGSFGAIENVPLEEARKQLEVNLFALAELSRCVLPHMRKQGSGRIVNVSSVAGRMVMAFGGWYHVSKYSVEALSDALRIESKPFGIQVSLIEPGPIRTAWGIIAADHLEDSSKGTVYADAALGEAATLRTAYSWKVLPSPEVVGKAIVRAVTSRHPRARYLVGFGARSIVFFHAILPTRWWDALMRSFTRIRLK